MIIERLVKHFSMFLFIHQEYLYLVFSVSLPLTSFMIYSITHQIPIPLLSFSSSYFYYYYLPTKH